LNLISFAFKFKNYLERFKTWIWTLNPWMKIQKPFPQHISYSFLDSGPPGLCGSFLFPKFFPQRPLRRSTAHMGSSPSSHHSHQQRRHRLPVIRPAARWEAEPSSPHWNNTSSRHFSSL
jgi:hypothetical protein